jgi:hypothetical protein
VLSISHLGILKMVLQWPLVSKKAQPQAGSEPEADDTCPGGQEQASGSKNTPEARDQFQRLIPLPARVKQPVTKLPPPPAPASGPDIPPAGGDTGSVHSFMNWAARRNKGLRANLESQGWYSDRLGPKAAQRRGRARGGARGAGLGRGRGYLWVEAGGIPVRGRAPGGPGRSAVPARPPPARPSRCSISRGAGP